MRSLSIQVLKVSKTASFQRAFVSQRKFGTFKPLRQKQIVTPPLSADTKSIAHLEEHGVVHKAIIDGLKKLGFTSLTAVQSKTIEPILETQDDVVTKAKTGTGKTLAFGIPLIEEIMKNPKSNPKVRSLIIAPTRDLAFQIRDELNKLANLKEVQRASFNRVTIKAAVGGESRGMQIRDITNRRNPASIVVATPGRFMDLVNEPDVADAFSNIETVVLDEADRLLGEGFREDLVQITDILKENREVSTMADLKPMKTMLFSATLDKPIVDFAKRILRENFHYIDTVDPNEPETHEKINQSLILTQNVFQSYSAAISFIQNESKGNRNFKAIVFLPTVKAVSYFYDIMHNFLRENNHRLRTNQLHGQLRQQVRDRAVKDFRNSFSGILVASDVGARGMDFPNVTNVIQIGLPMDATNYVHRVGRTARGGSSGKAVMILTKAESRFLRILKQRNVVIKDQFEYSPDEAVETQVPEISARVPHKFTLEMVIESLAGFGKSVSNNYKLNMYEILDDLRDTYAKFLNDPEAKPPVSQRYASQVLGLNRKAAEEFFAISGAPQSSYGDRNNFRDQRNFNNKDNGYKRERSFNNRDDGYNKDGRQRSFDKPRRFNRDGNFSERQTRNNDSTYDKSNSKDSKRSSSPWKQRGSSNRWD